MNYPLTERQTPSDFHNVRSSRSNTRQQSKSQQTYHEAPEQRNPNRHQGSISRTGGRAHVSPTSSPLLEECSSLDLETTAPLRAVKSGDIGLNGAEGKEHLDERYGSGWSADVADNFQLLEQYNKSIGIGQENLNSNSGDFQDYTDDGRVKNDFDTSASVSGRRKFVIPKVPDFSKLLERCT